MLIAVCATLLVACSTGAQGQLSGSRSAHPSPRIVFHPANGARGVAPDEPITVQVEHGSLKSIALTGPEGQRVPGRAGDGWFIPGQRLATNTSYQVTARVGTDAGKEINQRITFTTFDPDSIRGFDEDIASFDLVPAPGSAVGVGQPISLVFDRPVKNKADIERRLKVITHPRTEGSWGWVEEVTGRDRIDWRPKNYWRPGTEVILTTDLHNAPPAEDDCSPRPSSTHFVIGRSQIARVDLAAHTLTLIRDGRPVRILPVTGGTAEHATWSGILTLISKEGTVRMNSQSVGMDDAYDLTVQYAMRLTFSGTYAHQAEWAESTIGTANTSHGCLGMRSVDAAWFYDQAQTGDVFEVSGGKQTVTPGNGYGDWNQSWAAWQQRSALH
ncbi:L,D-transpeptidase [Streptomyces olivoreticuli]|nr:Ig-like domain-containing protein [Streptomyces olivoreticuli]